MKKKDFVMSIILHAFLAYLWIIFWNHINGVAYSVGNPLIGVTIFATGTWLFWEIAKRISPYNEYKKSHSIKIAGYISFGIVLAIYLFVYLI